MPRYKSNENYETITFCFKGTLPQDTTVNLYESSELFTYEVYNKGGSILGLCGQSVSNITAGSIAVKPTIDGTPAVSETANLLLNSENNNNIYSNFGKGSIVFIAGAKLGIQVVTSADLAPQAGLTIKLKVGFLERQ